MDDRLKKKVLIVDDDATARNSLKEILESDYHLFFAENAEEALERAGDEENMPDIILLDIILPEKKLGYRVCEELKSNPKTWYIPVIFITEHTEEIYKNKCFERGGVDYIVKPFEHNSVKTSIKIQLEMNNRLRTFYNSHRALYERSRAVQAQMQTKMQEMQDILKEQQGLISSLESIMKSPFIIK